MRGVLLALLIVATGVAAQGATLFDATPSEAAPTLSLLVHHPFPDRADPLGVDWDGRGADAYFARYRHLDAEGDGFDFPHTVFDGVVPIEGIPDTGAPYVSTRDAYAAAAAARADRPTPIDLAALWTNHGDDGLAGLVRVTSSIALDQDDLHLWAAAAEEPVHYAPPEALSNGVEVHHYVVRQVVDLGPATVGEHAVSFAPVDGTGPEAWDRERIVLVAWVQQGAADGLHFDAHEVAQSVTHAGGTDSATHSQGRSVLMEMYSATWCDTCLFGDRVAEEMAAAAGLTVSDAAPATSYLRTDGRTPYLVAVAVAVGLLLARTPLRGERP